MKIYTLSSSQKTECGVAIYLEDDIKSNIYFNIFFKYPRAVRYHSCRCRYLAQVKLFHYFHYKTFRTAIKHKDFGSRKIGFVQTLTEDKENKDFCPLLDVDVADPVAFKLPSTIHHFNLQKVICL